MSFTEFDQEEYDRNRRAEGISKGIAIGRSEGIEIGEQRGIEIGQQAKARETARKMKLKKYSITDIYRYN